MVIQHAAGPHGPMIGHGVGTGHWERPMVYTGTRSMRHSYQYYCYVLERQEKIDTGFNVVCSLGTLSASLYQSCCIYLVCQFQSLSHHDLT